MSPKDKKLRALMLQGDCLGSLTIDELENSFLGLDVLGYRQSKSAHPWKLATEKEARKKKWKQKNK